MATDVKGKTVVITGVMDGITREDAEAALTKLGARITGSVSANTDLVFVGLKPGSKLAKARALGITVLDERGLLAVMGKKAIAAARAPKPKKAKPAKVVRAPGTDSEPGVHGRTVVVTGELSVPRKEVEEMLRNAGANVTGSVSKKTDLLVVGASPGSKLADAERLGIPTMTEHELREALAGRKPSKKKGGDSGFAGKFRLAFETLEKSPHCEVIALSMPDGQIVKKHPALPLKKGEIYFRGVIDGHQCELALRATSPEALARTRVAPLWNEDVHTKEQIAFLKSSRVAVDHPDFGDYKLTLAHFDAKGRLDTFAYHVRGGSLPMDLDFAGMLQALVDLKGVTEWPMLYVNFGELSSWTSEYEKSLLDKKTRSNVYKSLKKSIESFARIFPGTDYAPYLKRLAVGK